MSTINGNKTGTHEHKTHFNTSVPQFLLSPPFLPHFNKEIKSYIIDYVLDTHI